MCEKYDELDDAQRETFDRMYAILEKDSPANWFLILDAIKSHAQIEALSQIPYRGPYPMVLDPS